MRVKLESVMIEVVRENPNKDTSEIRNLLEGRGYVRTYDTLAKKLKTMAEQGILLREAKGQPWNYYYRAKQQT